MSRNSQRIYQRNMFKFVSVAMLSAVAFVLMLLEFPLLPSNYLRMDFSDVPAIIGGIFFGPVYSVIIELVKNVLELLIKGMGTQMGFGNLMNFIVGCSFALPFSFIIRRFYKEDDEGSKSVFWLGVASVVSTIITVGLGFVANLGIAPLFFKYFLEIELDFNGALGAAITATAFNPIKCAILVTIMVIIVGIAMPRIKKALPILRDME